MAKASNHRFKRRDTRVAGGKSSRPQARRGGKTAPVNLNRLKLRSVHDRRHISQVDAFARVPHAGASFAEWFASLPGFLGAKRLRAVVDAIVTARIAGKPVAMAMGGHVVKVGCGPVVIDLMRRGIVTAVACHGATAIHDVEIAMLGATSEDVGDTIRDGRFGMVRETMAFFAEAAKAAVDVAPALRRCKQGRDACATGGVGYGAAIGRMILRKKLPNARLSVLATAAELNLPATVHVAVGTDTVHMSPKLDGAALGAATLADFRRICGVIAAMADTGDGAGGVWINVGSAVLMPEVFLKAVSVARNLGADLDMLTTVNMDMLRHYRPAQNVVGRPVARDRGHDLAGHHEILLPLLRQAIIERLPHG